MRGDGAELSRAQSTPVKPRCELPVNGNTGDPVIGEIAEITHRVEQLTPEQHAELRAWFLERDESLVGRSNCRRFSCRPTR